MKDLSWSAGMSAQTQESSLPRLSMPVSAHLACSGGDMDSSSAPAFSTVPPPPAFLNFLVGGKSNNGDTGSKHLKRRYSSNRSSGNLSASARVRPPISVLAVGGGSLEDEFSLGDSPTTATSGRFSNSEKEALFSLITNDHDLLRAFLHMLTKRKWGGKSWVNEIATRFNSLSDIKERRKHDAIRHHLKLRKNDTRGDKIQTLMSLLQHATGCLSKNTCNKCFVLHRLRVETGHASCGFSTCEFCDSSKPFVLEAFKPVTLLSEIEAKLAFNPHVFKEQETKVKQQNQEKQKQKQKEKQTHELKQEQPKQGDLQQQQRKPDGLDTNKKFTEQSSSGGVHPTNGSYLNCVSSFKSGDNGNQLSDSTKANISFPSSWLTRPVNGSRPTGHLNNLNCVSSFKSGDNGNQLSVSTKASTSFPSSWLTRPVNGSRPTGHLNNNNNTTQSSASGVPQAMMAHLGTMQNMVSVSPPGCGGSAPILPFRFFKSLPHAIATTATATVAGDDRSPSYSTTVGDTTSAKEDILFQNLVVFAKQVNETREILLHQRGHENSNEGTANKAASAPPPVLLDTAESTKQVPSVLKSGIGKYAKCFKAS